MTAPTAPTATLTPEQTDALSLLAYPGSDRPSPGYVLPQSTAQQAHRLLAKTLTAAGRPDLMQSAPARELGSIAADAGPFMLHPADEHAISTVARAFGASDLTMLLLTSRFLHDSKAKYRARQSAPTSA